ncbi:MAG: hypothetical protein LBP80_12230 [Treponema sp.]|jgi:hypothetical protein|nr:hypothetical protein [Treponema sp.]
MKNRAGQIVLVTLAAVLAATALAGCSKKGGQAGGRPVEITMWVYSEVWFNTRRNSKNFIAPFVDDEDFSFLEYIVPLQVTARRLSADLGINCNISSDPDFHRKMGSYIFG